MMRFNGYRIPSNRLKGYNYADNGWYFITICTFERRLYFGSVKNKNIIFSRKGKVMDEEWKKSSQIRKELLFDRYIGKLDLLKNH